MEETFRYRPVADTLPHRVMADHVVDGVKFKKGMIIQGSLTAIMNNPDYFPEPEKFIPERHLVNGKFQHDPRVCPFSTGLRNCVGKRLAQMKFFIFSTQLIHKFHIEANQYSLEPDTHNTLLTPSKFQLRFN